MNILSGTMFDAHPRRPNPSSPLKNCGIGNIFLITLICIGLATSPQVHAKESDLSLKQVHVIRIGIPTQLAQSDFDKSEYYQSVLKKLNTKLSTYKEMAWDKSLQFDLKIALGNEYQILDWMESGQLDGAVLPPFLWYILKNRVISKPRKLSKSYVGIDSFEDSSKPFRFQAIYRVFDCLGNFIVEDPALVYKNFLNEIYQRTKENVPEDLPKTKYQLYFPSHLSTSGALFPGAYAKTGWT